MWLLAYGTNQFWSGTPSLANQLHCRILNPSNFLIKVTSLISCRESFNSSPQASKWYPCLRIRSGFLPTGQTKLAGYPQNSVILRYMLFPAPNCALDTNRGVSSSWILRLPINLTPSIHSCIRYVDRHISHPSPPPSPQFPSRSPPSSFPQIFVTVLPSSSYLVTNNPSLTPVCWAWEWHDIAGAYMHARLPSNISWARGVRCTVDGHSSTSPLHSIHAHNVLHSAFPTSHVSHILHHPFGSQCGPYFRIVVSIVTVLPLVLLPGCCMHIWMQSVGVTWHCWHIYMRARLPE